MSQAKIFKKIWYIFWLFLLELNFFLTNTAPLNNNIKKILQIGDFHYDRDYSLNGRPKDFCHLNNTSKNYKKTKLGLYGDYKCDSPIVGLIL